ncbi:MAG: TatD family hydrolase [Thermodesulfobacteriota bacterium]
MMIDTHVHICDGSFDEDRGEVISRAAAAGVRRMIAVGETLEDARRNLELAEIHPELAAAAGLYPVDADRYAAEKMHEFIKKNSSRLAAIGEVGLDFRMARDNEDKQRQREILEGFAFLSLELDLPLNVHSRSAGRHAVELLLAAGAKRVQLHAFDGKAGAAMPAADAGYFFSVPPSVVRSRQKQKLVRRLPLSCLLLETDSPVLGPDPEKRNEPANCTVALEAVAELKNISSDHAAEAVYENTLSLYGDI